jgi:hypothetical protein
MVDDHTNLPQARSLGEMNVPDERGLKRELGAVLHGVDGLHGEMNVPDERGLKPEDEDACQDTYEGEMNAPDARGLKLSVPRQFEVLMNRRRDQRPRREGIETDNSHRPSHRVRHSPWRDERPRREGIETCRCHRSRRRLRGRDEMNVPDERGLKRDELDPPVERALVQRDERPQREGIETVDQPMNVPDERGLKPGVGDGRTASRHHGEMNVPDERGLKLSERVPGATRDVVRHAAR